MNVQTKDFKQMTVAEQMAWLSDFEHWSSEKLPVLCALGNAWESSSIKSMEEGLRLIAVFGYCRDFVQKSLLFRDFARRIDRLQFYVDKIRKEVALGRAVRSSTGDTIAEVPQVQPRRRGRPTKAESEARKAAVQTEPKTDTPAVSATPQTPAPAPTPQTEFATALALSNGGEARLHLDQLAWLMSKELQVRIKDIAGLRATAAKESNQAKELAEREVPAAIIEPHTRAAIEATNAYKQIYADIDKELALLYSALTIGGEHIPSWEERCKAKGITLNQLQMLLRPYWEKQGQPLVELESVTEPSPFEDEAQKKLRAAAAHRIRTYFFRKDVRITQNRIDKMREMIEELRSYDIPTDEYEAVLDAHIKELDKQAPIVNSEDLKEDTPTPVKESTKPAQGSLFD